MHYTQLTDADVQQMCRTIGIKDIEELFAHIPPDQRCRGDLDLPRPLSEPELLAEINRLASANRDCTQQVCFLGGGALSARCATESIPYKAQSSTKRTA